MSAEDERCLRHCRYWLWVIAVIHLVSVVLMEAPRWRPVPRPEVRNAAVVDVQPSHRPL